MCKTKNKKRKFLIALPTFPGQKGFNCQTILLSGKDKFEAIGKVDYFKPKANIGDVKEVDY